MLCFGLVWFVEFVFVGWLDGWMVGCFDFWRFGDLLIVWLFDCLVVCLVGSLVGWLVCFVLSCFVWFYSLLLYGSIGGLENSMYRKV